MNLSQQFRAYIQTAISNNKAVLGTAVRQNLGDPNDDDYGTWTVQPLDDEPPIFGVVSGQENKPIAGSLVVVQFLDNQNAFITSIFDYDTRSVIAKLLEINITNGIQMKGASMSMQIQNDFEGDAKTLNINITQNINIEGNGIKLKSNGQDLGQILSDISGALTTLGGAVGSTLPPLPTAPTIAANVATFNS